MSGKSILLVFFALTLTLFLSVSKTTFAQSAPSPYDDLSILSNSVFESEVYDAVMLMVIKHPSNGTARSKGSSGARFLEYTPDSNFVGLDSVSIEVQLNWGANPVIQWYHFAFDVKESIVFAYDVEFAIPSNSDFTFLDVMMNDSSTHGDLSFSNISLVSKGMVDLVADSLFFKPLADYSGVAYVTYSVCDSLGECASANAVINVIDSANVVSDYDIHISTMKNRNVRVLLPGEEFELSLDPELGVVVQQGSTGIWEYRPFQNVIGLDTFSFEMYPDYHRNVFVKIYDTPSPNTFLVDNFIYTPKNQDVSFDVQENDFKKNVSINSFTHPENGVLSHQGSGNFHFVPDSNFTGSTGFSYTACILGNCETAKVIIFVGDLNPQNSGTYELTTTKNRPLVINYDVPISNFSFNLTQDPELGELVIYPGLDTITVGCSEVSGNNLVVYTPDTDVIGLDEFELEYCIDGSQDCHIVKIELTILDLLIDSSCVCVENCVWPGDVNHDGVVDMRDVLSLGYYIGSVGEARDDVDLENWYGQSATDWGQKQYNGQNLKHADTDGDGIVQVQDTFAISEFYNRVHTLLAEESLQNKPYYVGLHESTSGPYQAGDLVVLDVVIGTENSPVIDLHGLALSFSFSNTPFSFNSLTANELTSSWLTYDAPSLFMQKEFDNQQLDFALTRTDGFGAAGFGLVTQVSFIVEDDIDGIRWVGESETQLVEILLDAPIAYFANGAEFQLPDTNAFIEMLRPGRNAQKDFSDDLITVFPNPTLAGNEVNIHVNGGYSIELVEIYDLQGRMLHNVENINGNSTRLHLDELSSGIYLLRISTDGGIVTRKLSIQH
ncbi:MAG: T9SS C-terminal target domain-containing protein [Saprospirales bacterium]|nr:MAG: T9SS C-terminal target domain-containing protein [Saprospirales bacterium]